MSADASTASLFYLLAVIFCHERAGAGVVATARRNAGSGAASHSTAAADPAVYDQSVGAAPERFAGRRDRAAGARAKTQAQTHSRPAGSTQGRNEFVLGPAPFSASAAPGTRVPATAPPYAAAPVIAETANVAAGRV